MEEKLNKIVEMLSLVTTRLDKVESNISTNKVNSPVTNLEQRINVEDVEDRSTSTINTFRSKDLIPTIIDKKNEESSTAKLKKLLAIKHQEVNQEVNLFEQLEISGSDNNCGAQSILTAYKNQYERKFPSGRSTGPIAIRKLLANAVSKSTMIQATVFEDKAAYIRRDLSSSEKLNAYIDLITNPVNANSTGYRLTDYEMEVLAEVNKLNIVIINDRKDKDIYPATRSFNGGIDNPIITFIYNINSNHYNVLYIKAFCQYEERAQIKIIGSAQRNKDLLFADNKYYIVNFSSDNPFPNALHKDLLQETPERLETDDFPLHSVYKDNDNDDDGDQMFTVTKKDLERLLLAKKRNGNGIQAGVNTFVPLLLDTGVERSNTGIARTPFAAFNSIPPLYSSRTSRPKEADVDRTLGSTKKQMQDHMSDLEKLKEIQGKRSKDKHTTPFDSDDSTSSTSSSSINDSSSTSSSSRSKKSKKNKKKKDRRRRNQRATIIRRQINLVEAKLLYEADNMTFNEVADHLRKINDFRNDPSNKGADFLIFSTIASENLRELIFNKCYEHFKKKLGKRHPTIASELVKLSDEDFVEALWFYSAPTSISKAIKVLRDVPLKISNKVTMENYRMSASNFEKFMAFATAYMNRFEHVYKQLGTYCDPTSVPRSFQVPATKGERLSGAINILMDSMHQICPWFTNYYNNMQEEVKRSIRNKLSLSEFCELFKSIIVKVHAVMKEASKYIQYGYNNEDKPPSRLSILQRDPSRRVSFEQEEMPGLNDIDEEIELEGGFDMTDAFYNIDPIRNERKSISGLTLYQPPSKTTRFEAKDKGDAYYAGKPCFKQDKCPGKDNGSCKFNHDKDFYKKYMDDLSKIQKRPSLSYIEQVFNHIRETGTADLDDLDTEVLMGIINHAKKLSPAHILTKVVSTEDDELQAREDSEDGRQGADSANYIYQYYLNMLKEFMDLDVYQIEEYVKFGDQKQTAIYEAVALKVRFEDVVNPMSAVVDEGRFHIFKVINVPTAPNTPTPPLIIGLPTICSWYLTLLVNTLNHNHKLMHTGMKSQETFEEELRRLRIRPIATRVSKRKNEDLDANNSNKLCKIAIANELDTDDIQLEIECKFVLGYKLKERLAKLDCTEIIIIDTYYDNLGDYWISGSDKWLRQRGNKFELKMPSLIGHQGGISSYMEVTTNTAILEALSIYGHTQEITFDEMKMILKKHHIIPYARIETFRKSFKGLTQKVSSEYEQFIYPNCPSHKHLYQIDVDDAHLICTLTHERSNYVIAEVELAKPYIMDPIKSITDVMNQLNIDPAVLQQSLNGTLVECVKRHNLKCYEILLANGVVKDPQSLLEIADLKDMEPGVVDEVAKYHYATQLQLDQKPITRYPPTNNNNNALFCYEIPPTNFPTNLIDEHRYESIHDLLSEWDQLDTYTSDSTDTYDLYCNIIKDTSTKLSQFQFLQSHEKVDLKEKLQEIDAMIFNAFNREEYMEATIPPWSFVYEESPEELGSYIPCDNTGLYNYLSTTYDEALDKYRQDCLKACHPAAYEYLKDVLNSDLCIDQFCPKEWLGMKNVEPIDIKFSPAWEQVKIQGLGPKGTKAFVNEKMKPYYHKEFQRMLLYMYKPSNSSTASRIQVADKATPPWVRICGDYRPVNKYVLLPQVNIPNVEHQINRAKNANMFLNIDLANGFHNMPISEATSQALALSTEFGLVQPRFMPEGVRSAPQEFQRLMRHTFSSMEDCAIVIWDNVLILCDDLADLKQKFIQVLNLCKHYNIILKMAKSEIGFNQAAFFGYLVKKNTVELTQDRKDGINAMTFFKSLKGAQSFLGSCIFFQKFVPNYAELSAPLNSMTHKNFNWDESTWTIDYRKSFEDLKQAIQKSMVLHFPDYSKLWILRTDTSKDAVGVALFQVGDDGIFEPIAFYSQKLSDQARNWSAVKLEAYGVYFGVKKFAYFLLGHQFVIEVDHANLVTMETSDQYIIQRWRSFLEPFAFRIRHIKGKHNLLADYQSRMFSLISHTLDDNTFYHNHDASYAMLERYAQVCHLPINAYWYQPLSDIFTFATAIPESSVDVIIRDPIRTSITPLGPSQSLTNAFLAHAAANTYTYLCDGVIVTHATVVNTIPHQPHVVLDAIPTSLFSVTKFPQQVSSLSGKGQEKDAKKTEIENTVTPLVSNTDIDTFEDILDDAFTPEFLEQLRDIQAKVKQFIKEHHGHRRLHYGANRLYKEVCTLYPGHRLPQSFFIDAIAKCALCQKLRLQKDTLFAEQIRTLKRNPYARSAVCVDRLTITPESQNGNTTVILLADLFTRLCKIYASSDYTSEAVAQCLKDWFITYGSYDVLQSDPGSDILGGAVDAINKRWKLSRKISLVDRHESNGNERLNQEALRHLRALCADERAKECWDDIDYLGFVNLVMNQEVNSEIGMSPFVATFGKRDEAYFFLPEVDRTSTRSSKKYIDKLNESLSLVRKLNAEHQRAIHDQRTSKTPPIRINQLRKNDVVWMRRKSRIDPNGKLQMRNKGPFVVISVLKNDVRVKHIITNKEEVFHIKDIIPVNLDTPNEELIETAKLDQDQFTVVEVIAWRGDTKKRMTLEFLTIFDDEYREWKHFIDPDFRVNSSLDTFIKSQGNEILLPLLHTDAEYKLIERENSKKHILDFTCIYADYRLHPLGWRDRVGLPPLEPPFKYVIEVNFVKRISDAKIKAHVSHPAYDITIDYNWFTQYGQEPTFNPNTMILIDSDMVEKYPALTFT